jgi:uncharacterized protein (TIGR02302 family)
LNGVTPDPSDPIRDGDALSRLKLAQALQRATYAIAWERAWPGLARLLTVLGLFLVVSWAGLWLALPFLARAIGLLIFAGVAIAALFPLIRFRWPSRAEALARLDRGSGIRHRPATTLTDTLSSQDPVAQALWQAQRERTLASLKRMRAGLPHPRLPLHDPWALRALVMVMLVATFFAAGDERAMRLGAAFNWNGVLAPSTVRVDAWVTPPLYTGKPPIILSAANKEAAALPASGPLAVPAGSTLIVRSSGGNLDVATSGGLKEVAPTEAAPKGTSERHFTIATDGTAQVRAPSGQPPWAFAATPDRPPTIALAKDPERQAYGALQLSYKIEDDYGVTGAEAQFVPRAADGTDSKDADTKAARPLFQPPQFALTLPNARTRNAVGQMVKDLSEDPYSGADVTLTLTAKDEAGNEARSEPFNMRLPGRLFTKPLARALIEQRRMLALDANKNSDVYAALDALMIAPDMFMPEAGQYLGLYSVARQLEAARTDESLREVVASLWALAVTIEDGNTSDVEKALRAAQDALKQALQRGASDEELKKLMDNLRTALDNYMKQFAQQMRNNPLARPAVGLEDQMKRIERLIQRGNRDAAARELDRLARLLERPPGPPSAEQREMDEIARELNDLLREQNALRDETDRQGKDSKRGQRGAKPLPPKVAEILRKSRELRQKTRGATTEQLDDLARQQEALRQELRTWRDSQGRMSP